MLESGGGEEGSPLYKVHARFVDDLLMDPLVPYDLDIVSWLSASKPSPKIKYHLLSPHNLKSINGLNYNKSLLRNAKIKKKPHPTPGTRQPGQ